MAFDNRVWRCGIHEITFDRPRVMGVLNVTPDSFSDGGEHASTQAAIEHGLNMLDAGADIIDVGGESTRPGFTPVDPTEETARVLPVIRALVDYGAVVSIDTRHVEVAKAAVRAGACIVNDVTGFTDPAMVEFVANNDCGVIVMHAGEVSTPVVQRHVSTSLSTSAAAYSAEKAQAAEKGNRILEMESKLSPNLPFAQGPSGSAAGKLHPEEEKNDDKKAVEDTTEEVSKSASEQKETQGEDVLAGVMARSKANYGTGGFSTSQLRRFTLPDSAPIMRNIMGFLSDQARALTRAGVARDRICIDPGAGFGKSANEDIVIQRETAKMASLGYPLLCAISRKRFVGAVSGVKEAAGRDSATFGACIAALEQGANIVRVHDVEGFTQFLNAYWSIAHLQPRRAFVALGSNMGDRLANIRAARDLIANIPLTCVTNCSHIYESEPAYLEDQDAFVNAVIELRTELAPTVLLDELLKIEDELDRVRVVKNGPRTIDCDLLWVDGEYHAGRRLRLPHPAMGERDFVMVPLEDLMHDPARFLRHANLDVLPAEERFGHIVADLGEM